MIIIDKKFIFLLTLIIILVVIIIGLFIKIDRLGNSLNKTNEIGRYEFHKANDVNMLILDTVTGKMWIKYIHPTGGNEEWVEETDLLRLMKMDN